MRRFALLPVLLGTLIGAPPAVAWTWPVDGPVLRAFHFDGDPYGAGLHRGVDVGGPAGMPVRAPASGTVSFAGTVPGGGRTVTIQTADGYAVTLLHLGSIAVRRGALVGEGEPMAVLGSSGEPEHPGAYVHLGIRIAADPQGYVDPLGLLPTRSGAPADDPDPAPAPEDSEPPPGPVEEGGAAEPGPAPPVEIPAESPAPVGDAPPPVPAPPVPELEPAMPVLAPPTPSAPPVFGEPGVGDANAPSPVAEIPSGASATKVGVASAPVPSPTRPLGAASSRSVRLVAGEAGGSTPSAGPDETGLGAAAPVAKPVVEASLDARGPVAQAADGGDGAAASLALGLATAALAALLGSYLAVRRRRLVRHGSRRPARKQAQAVAQGRDRAPGNALDRAQARQEAGAPFVALDDEAHAPQCADEGRRIAERDVGFVPGEDEVALLQALDRMPRVRRVDGEHASGDEDTEDLGEHPGEVGVLQMLDEVGGDGLVERLVREGQGGGVGELERERREDPGRDLHRPRLRVDADCPAAERRKEVRHRAACRADVQHALTRLWSKQVAHCRKPKARPGRLLEIDARHARHERRVVRLRRAADPGEPHELVTRSRR